MAEPAREKNAGVWPAFRWRKVRLTVSTVIALTLLQFIDTLDYGPWIDNTRETFPYNDGRLDKNVRDYIQRGVVAFFVSQRKNESNQQRPVSLCGASF